MSRESDWVGAPYQKNSDTSREAAEKVVATLSTRRATLLNFLRSMPEGLTDNEMIAALTQQGWSPNGVRPRRIELVRMGLVQNIGVRNGSHVWVAVASEMDDAA